MLAAERRRLIAEGVRARGVVSVAEMAEVIGTTEITLRRDLQAMARDGLLVRTHGGAIRPSGVGHEPSYSEKAHQAAAEKVAIARLALEMVRPGDSIVLGPGTTTLRAQLPDQAALWGLVQRIIGLGLKVVDLHLVTPG